MKKISLYVAAVVMLTVLFGSLGISSDVSDYDQYLINALKDDNHGIRTSAAQLLGERKVEAAVKPLIKMLQTEKRYACRIIVAKALYDIGDKKALPAPVESTTVVTTAGIRQASPVSARRTVAPVGPCRKATISAPALINRSIRVNGSPGPTRARASRRLGEKIVPADSNARNSASVKDRSGARNGSTLTIAPLSRSSLIKSRSGSSG